jgi:hypothetical protein
MFSLAACSGGSGMQSRELTSRVTGLSTDLVRELMITMQFTQDLDSLDVLMRGLDLWPDREVAEPPDEPAIPPDIPPPPPDPRSDEPDREGESQEVDPDAVAADIELFLNDIIFNPDNLEIDSADSAVFLLSGAVLCDPEAYGPSYYCEPRPCDPRDAFCQEDTQKFVEQCKEDEALAQAECRARIDALEIRVAVSAEGPGANIQVRIGPQGNTPVKFSVQPDRIAAEVNLAEIRDVVLRIAEVIGEQEPLELPEVMDGKFSLSLTRNQAGMFTLQNSILTDVRVLMPLPEEQGNLEINVEQADPLSTLVIDGTNEKIEASWDLNSVEVSFPFGSRFESGTGNFLIEIAGVEGNLTASVGDDTVRLNRLGLGGATSRVMHDQTVLASVDLNPDSGRHFDLSVSEVGEMPLFAFSDLILDVYVNLGHLDPYLGVDEEPAPAELRDQTYRLRLTDAGLLPVEGTETQERMLKVVTGSLSLSSTAVEATIEAQAGQCLMPAETCPEESHAVLECMSVFDCP